MKRWPGWVLLVLVVVGVLAVGATRADGPSTPAERIDAIARRIACPICDGESVFESRNTASVSIRTEIAAQVDDGGRTDDEIIGHRRARFGGHVLLVPEATGLDTLVWALPVAALRVRRRRPGRRVPALAREAAAERDPTDDDRALVARALASDDCR